MMMSIVASCRAVAGRSRPFALADFDQASAQGGLVEACKGKRGKDRNAVLQIAERGHESRLAFDFAAFYGGGVFDAPVRRHRLARPDRTSFAGCVVADGEYEIHDRG